MTQYLVTWEIDIEAASPIEAARAATAIQRDPSSIATVFRVAKKKGPHEWKVDLSAPSQYGERMSVRTKGPPLVRELVRDAGAVICGGCGYPRGAGLFRYFTPEGDARPGLYCSAVCLRRAERIASNTRVPSSEI